MMQFRVPILLFLLFFFVSSVIANGNYDVVLEQVSGEKHASLIEPSSYDPDLTCRDFLREFDDAAPDYFQYERCDVDDYGQTRSIEAIYKIEGKDAKQAQEYLTQKMGMTELKLVCCHWEMGGQNVTIINPKDNMYYYVVLVSEETIEHDRDKVTFYLIVSGDRSPV
ncbi:DUF4952 domain-containing protein [Gilliamella sp. ESL0254]|nr:DUF4952 domain-containing protein [Gilliamella sp. ESL0254]